MSVQSSAGDILVLVNGEYVVVEKVQHEIIDESVIVYNFSVEDYHTYYVSSGVLVHNTCPNPNGKKGSAAHQNKVNEIGTDLQAKGYNVDYEYRVSIDGGYKRTRYIDIFAHNDYESFGVQVGLTTKGGLPVIRERRALADLAKAGITAHFLATNRRVYVWDAKFVFFKQKKICWCFWISWKH